MKNLLVALLLSGSFAYAMDDVTGGHFGRSCEQKLTATSFKNLGPIGRVMPDRIWQLSEVKKYPGLKAAHDKNSQIPLWPIWREGIEKLGAMRVQVESFRGDERAAYLRIIALVEAALTKHTLVFVTAARPKDFDVKDHVAVLRAIARVDLTKLRLSLYDVKAAIERKLSTTEYLNCI